MTGPQRSLPLGRLSALILIATLSLATTANSQSPLLQGLDLLDGSLQTLSFSEDPVSGVLITSIEVDGETWVLELSRHSVRADNFEILIDDGSGTLTPFPAPPVVTWKGVVIGKPDSRVRAYYDAGEMRATIHADGELFAVQPASDSTHPTTSLDHVVYSALQLAPLPFTCGTPDQNRLNSGGSSGSGAQPFGSALLRTCEVGIDADFAYYQANGSSVVTTVNDIETVMNSVDGTYYISPIWITYEITTIVVRTTSGHYISTSPGTLLSEFDSKWSSTPESLIQADVAHLFTGKNLDGSVIGIARLSSICVDSNHFGLSQSKFSTNFTRRVALTSHEYGHNWSAFHCNGDANCRIMCSGLGGCDGLNPLTFTTQPNNEILSHKNSRTCLTITQPAQPIPFDDNFGTPTVNSLRWTYNDGGIISTAGVGEPSGNQSLNLDSVAGAYGDDEVRSNRLLLQGTNNTSVGYYAQHRGVENGEQLVIEYLNSAFHWVELNRITSDGNDQTAFDFYEHSLPGNALHNEFRLRFRTRGNDASDDWFIDDVVVVEGPVIPIPPTIDSIAPARGNTNGGQQVIVFGSDFGGDAIVTVGGVPLLNQQLIGDTQIWGTTPPGTVGMQSISVSQTSGSDSMAASYEYVLATIAAESKELPISSSGNTIEISCDNGFDMSAFSFGLDYDSSLLQIDAIDVIGTVSEPATTFGFVYNIIDNSPGSGGGFVTMAVLMDSSPPLLAEIAPGSNNVLARLEATVLPAAAAGSFTTLEFKDTLGLPPVETVLATSGGNSVSVHPDLVNGVIDFVAASPFIRGDSNSDGSVNVADAVTTLAYAFDGGTVDCLVALDANDDDAVNVADAVTKLNYLFSGGAPLPPPFPTAGVDPTPGVLMCEPAP